jgi:hypothetical protein
MSQDKKEAFFNRSLERALCILNAFNSENSAFTVTELSVKLGLSRATIVRLCTTLVRYNFLRQEPGSKRYLLGFKLFELGSLVFYSFALRKIITHFLSQLQVRLDGSLFLEFLESEELLQRNHSGSHEGLTMTDEKTGTRDIENRMCAFPGTYETAVINGPDEMTGEQICAYVVLKPGVALTQDEIVAYLRKEGALEQQVPWKMDFLEGLPLTKATKANKKALREDMGKTIGG